METSDKKGIEILTLTESERLPDDTFTKIVYDALNSSMSGVAIMDLDGFIKWINPAFIQMLGASGGSQLIDIKLTDLLTSHHIREIEDIKRSVDQALKKTVEFEFRNEDGDIGYIELFYSDIRNYSGDIVGKMVSVHNITHRKLLENRLRQTSAKLVNAQEEERERVARELHDSIGASLASLKFTVEEWAASLENQFASLQHEPIVKRIQSIIDEVHQISKNLHPSILHDLGFCTAVQAFCRETRESFPEVNIQLDLDVLDADIPEKLKIVLYRVIQEGVTNAVRHAAPQTIDVSLRKIQAAIMLEIIDNGMGFDPNTLHDTPIAGKGMGLRNIQDRAEIFEGTFELDSIVDRGTSLKLTWPLQTA